MPVSIVGMGLNGMASVVNRLRRVTRRFGKTEDGTASVEALFWIPAFLAVFALMVDASFIYHNEARILRVVQDANRNLSNTRHDTGAEVETYIKARLANLNITPKSVTALVDTDATGTRNNAVITTVVVEAKTLQMVGLFGALFNSDLEVVGIHIAETAEWDFFDSMVATGTL